jgi:hypothetical protein
MTKIGNLREMAAPDVSITELMNGVSNCKSIWKSFSDKNESLPVSVRLLGSQIEALGKLLENHSTNLEDRNLSDIDLGGNNDLYLGYGSIKRTLDEFPTIIHEYQQQLSKHLERPKKWLKSSPFVFDDKKILDLQARIAGIITLIQSGIQDNKM